MKGQQSESALELQAGMQGLGSKLDVIYFSTASGACDKGHNLNERMACWPYCNGECKSHRVHIQSGDRRSETGQQPERVLDMMAVLKG